ncbi:MAG: DUF3618 domain-containing protein [Betaproteobacteria bacterium]
MNSHRRTSRQIEADIGDIRRDMDRTLDALEKRLSPRELIRETVDSVGRLQTGRYLVGAASVARRHPVGTAVAAVGVTLAISLMYAWRNR